MTTKDSTPSFGRYAELPLDKMTPQQQEGYRALAQVEGDGSPNLPGPLKIWVNNPNLALAVAPLAAHFRPPHHSLSQREREIAVCVITGKWHAPYSINAHTEIAITLGLPGDMVNALACGLPASFVDRREQLVYEIATALAAERWIPWDLYDRAIEALGHDGITDLIVLMGFYTAISLTLVFCDVPADAAGMQREAGQTGKQS
jgi:4-carboxymuconolactone decarboxylase